MKFNERELGQYAAAGETLVDMKGYLHKRGERPREGYRQRWFILKGNLLFYYKTHNFLEAIGCVVLERVSVALTSDANVPYGFKLEFDGPGSRTYYLGADSDETRQRWMEVLKVASYEHIRSVLLSLRERMQKLTGRDPLKAMQGIVKPDVMSYDPESKAVAFARQSLMRKKQSSQRKAISRPPSVLEESPVVEVAQIELNIGCAELSCDVDENSAVFVVVQEENTQSKLRTENQKTEAIPPGDEVYFVTTAHVAVKPDTALIFQLFKKPNKEDADAVPSGEEDDNDDDDYEDVQQPPLVEESTLLGSARCSLADLTDHDESRISIEAEGNSDLIIGQLLLESRQTLRAAEPAAEDGPMYMEQQESQTISTRKPFPLPLKNEKRLYRFPTIGQGKIKVRESMFESTFLFCIPEQLMRLFIDEDKSGIKVLDELGVLYGPVETVRRALLNKRMERVQAYTMAQSRLDAYQGPNFKKSVMKKKKEVEMLATNCHVQQMRVENKSYYTVTMGAPAAHCMKFSHGGLRRLLDSERSSQEAIGLPRHNHEVVEAISNLNRLQAAVEKTHSKLSHELDQTVIDFDRIDDIVNALDQGIEALKDFFGTSIIDAAISRASAARPPRSTLKGVGFELGPKDLVEAVVKSFKALHDSLASAMDSEEARRSITSQHILGIQEKSQDLHVTVSSTCLEALECLQIVRLQGQQVPHESQDLVYRRDVCFSQAVTSLITSFTTELYNRISDVLFLQQIAELGFLIHYESLLSTSGDEIGMIEDMMVAISDLATVTIKLGVSDTIRPPSISGRRYHMQFTLFLDATTMKNFPVSLQNGKPIRIVPLLFSQGVNEKQTLANKIGDTELQDRINKENMTVLSKYISNYKEFLNRKVPSKAAGISVTIDRTFTKFRTAMQSKKQKNLDILTVGHDIIRHLSGGRLTMCKSGKDRTSMSVTLEQCNLLINHHSLVPSVIQQALDAMRSVGTRRANVTKNIGEPRYAFNKFQVACLPKMLKPPIGTYGANVT